MSANGKRLPLEVVASSILKTLRDFAWLSKKSDENLRMHTLLVEILNRSFGQPTGKSLYAQTKK